MCEKYNGHSNYQTWVTELWMDNDQNSQLFWLDMAKQYDNVADLSRYLKFYYEEENPVKETSGVFADLMQYQLDAINWDEIASSYLKMIAEGY